MAQAKREQTLVAEAWKLLVRKSWLCQDTEEERTVTFEPLCKTKGAGVAPGRRARHRPSDIPARFVAGLVALQRAARLVVGTKDSHSLPHPLC